jgi:hypothetical protein
MSSSVQQCPKCGRLAGPEESLQVRDALRPGEAPVALCPRCAAEQTAAANPQMAYRFCDECHGPIEPGRAEVRWRTERHILGPMANHPSVAMSLCPDCAKKYDRTGNSMIVTILIFFAVLFVLAFASWFLK